MNTLDQIADEAFQNAKGHGFHDTPSMSEEDIFVVAQCNNLHGEVSELHDAWRAGNFRELCDKSGSMEALGLIPLTCAEEELADIILRVCDFSRRIGVDIAQAVRVKHAYNKSRPHKHGGKKS